MHILIMLFKKALFLIQSVFLFLNMLLYDIQLLLFLILVYELSLGEILFELGSAIGASGVHCCPFLDAFSVVEMVAFCSYDFLTL